MSGYGYSPASFRVASSASGASVLPADFAAISLSLDRLEELIDQETKMLAEHRSADVSAFTHRKSHMLLELTRSMRGLEPHKADATLRVKLQALRAKLDRNQALLHTHLRAVQEIASVIARAIRSAESDGTYSDEGWGRRPC